MKNDDIECVRGCRMLTASKCIDDRGILCFAEGETAIPFDIKRIFWICGVPEGKTRGGHSHSTCTEAIFPVKGHFDIEVSDGINAAAIRMEEPTKGILIPAGIWCDLKNFSSDAICVVAASQHYDAGGYINDYKEYKKLCK